MTARGSDERARQKPKRRSILRDILACILPILSLGISLAGAVYIFTYLRGSVASAEVQLAADEQQPSPSKVEPEPVYTGVEDPWVTSGTFTVGARELDDAIKEFCDEHTNEGDTPQEAAQATYNAIVQSNYIDLLEKPSGTNWVHRSAQQFFSYKKKSGAVPEGDYYEFAAVTALCLRYFGYSDAIALPVLHGNGMGSQYGSALCLVTNSDGVASVCDPALGADGWMIKRAGYNILVDDIGQDLSTAEGLGLEIQRKEENLPDAYADGMGVSGGNGATTTGYDRTGMNENGYGGGMGTTTGNQSGV